MIGRFEQDAFAAAPPKHGGHRVLGDIRASIAELGHYRATFFR